MTEILIRVDAVVMGIWCNGQLLVLAFIVILLLSSLWFIWNNSFCQIPVCYTCTASNFRNLPITPGLLYINSILIMPICCPLSQWQIYLISSAASKLKNCKLKSAFEVHWYFRCGVTLEHVECEGGVDIGRHRAAVIATVHLRGLGRDNWWSHHHCNIVTTCVMASLLLYPRPSLSVVMLQMKTRYTIYFLNFWWITEKLWLFEHMSPFFFIGDTLYLKTKVGEPYQQLWVKH